MRKTNDGLAALNKRMNQLKNVAIDRARQMAQEQADKLGAQVNLTWDNGMPAETLLPKESGE